MSFSTILEEVGKDVVLALNIGGQLSPLLGGAIALVTKLINPTTGEVEYTVVINAGKAENDKAGENFRSTLEKINAERAAASLPALDIPDFDNVVPETPTPTPQEASLRAGQKGITPAEDDSDARREGLERG